MNFSLSRLAFPGWKYALAALIVVAAGYFYFNRGSNPGATLVVRAGDFSEEVSVSGTVIASRDVSLGFAASGRISGVYAGVGQHVSAGTILAQTENGDLAATVAQKKATLASLEAGTRPEEVAVKQSGVASAKAALISVIQNAYTTADDAVHNRADSFFTNPRTTPKLSFTVANATLESSVEQGRTSVEATLLAWAKLVASLTPENAAASAAQAQSYAAAIVSFLAAANDALNHAVADQSTSAATLSTYSTTLATARTNMNTSVTTLTGDISALNDAQKALTLAEAGATASDIAAAKAEVESAQANLAKTLVVAPFGGVVTKMDAKVGEIVSPSTSEISMQSDGLFEVETYIPEISIARVAKGDHATTTLDAYGAGVAFPSVVVSVDPAETVKDGVPTYKTTLSFLSADPRIRSGMTANVTIETGVLHDAVVIPSGAITSSGSSSYVSVVHEKTIEQRVVTTGIAPSLGQIQILSGLSSGEVILLTPGP